MASLFIPHIYKDGLTIQVAAVQRGQCHLGPLLVPVKDLARCAVDLHVLYITSFCHVVFQLLPGNTLCQVAHIHLAPHFLTLAKTLAKALAKALTTTLASTLASHHLGHVWHLYTLQGQSLLKNIHHTTDELPRVRLISGLRCSSVGGMGIGNRHSHATCSGYRFCPGPRPNSNCMAHKLRALQPVDSQLRFLYHRVANAATPSGITPRICKDCCKLNLTSLLHVIFQLLPLRLCRQTLHIDHLGLIWIFTSGSLHGIRWWLEDCWLRFRHGDTFPLPALTSPVGSWRWDYHCCDSRSKASQAQVRSRRSGRRSKSSSRKQLVQASTAT
mmetsp:Transcript_114342/g.220149  ORF Transcript_114342/g.220149 Transcript_114342/m.220149 type:complete len:329 (+) Transcript_114342:67-1053(+)